MDMIEPKILDASEPLSKALDEILRSGTAVFVTKERQLFGLIDDRNLRMGISDPSKARCDNACVKCPSIGQQDSVEKRLEAFLAGHFKSLPVIDAKGAIVGATTRADFLRELAAQKLIPRAQVYQHMNRPAQTIDYERTIADAKTLMKKTGVHRVVVTRGGNIAGSLSTMDFAGMILKPRERQQYQLVSQVKNLEGEKISEIMRPNVATIEETATLAEAAEKMASANISNLVVIMDKKPTGIIAATDIFKLVRSLYIVQKDVLVSGLDAESLAYYGKIKEEILGIIGKFENSLKVENITVHVKKGKSVFEAHTSFDLNNRHTSFKSEGYNLGDTIAALSKELKIMLEKAKSEKMERKKPPRGEPE
ncbi:Inosine-5'-monophosphate dehydrogenase [uncultured archaeon]|nr:Inosine-5'-monophosphate dehydrogenase [uncultured archaeon]